MNRVVLDLADSDQLACAEDGCVLDAGWKVVD